MKTARFSFYLVLAALAAFLALPTVPALAASYVVDTTSDASLTACTAAASDCSLRGAITDANASGTGDVITFDPAVFPSATPATIAIASALPNLTGFSHTIDGTGAGVIVDAVNTEPDPANFACFTIQTNGVTIKGLQITDCNPGVSISSGFNSTVGPGNVIYDNGTGVWNDSSGSGNRIIGNMIGTTADGTAVNPNGGNITGVMAVGSGATIGGTGAGEGNVISGNVANGLVIQGNINTVQGNMIGTDVSGTLDVGNGMDGVVINVTASGVTIGGATTAARNVISGNNRHGVYMTTSNAATVQGNYIGIDATGTADLGNSQDGVVATVGSKGIYQNVISGNDQAGVHLLASTNSVQANLIGVNAAGTAAVGNGGAGVLIDNNSTNNSVGGGSGATTRNVISGNGGAGVELTFSTSGNVIKGNYIGTNITGTAAVPNAGSGLKLTSNTGNTIGGSGAGEGNLISGNAMSGIEFSSASNSTVYGNLIGTQADGTTALGNGSNGVLVTSAASGNSIGSGGSYANVIAFNAAAGVWVQSGTGNAISGNSIHSNGGLGIDLSTIGVTANDAGDTDVGANNTQNFPVLTLARTDGSTLVVDGSLNSLASTSFLVLFYANDDCDGSGYGEGRTFLGSNVYATDAAGNVAFSKTLSVSVPAGQFATATATRSGDTSEFSACTTVQKDSDLDGVPDASDNCPAVPNSNQANADGDAFGDACDACPSTADPAACPDDDNDGFTDEAEAGSPLCAGSANDDSFEDTVVNDGCPGGPAQSGAYSEAQFNIGTGSLDPCGNNGWPAELAGGDNRIKLQDVTSFAVPAPKKLNTSPGMTGFDPRWDLVPGQRAGLFWISLQDLTALTAGPAAYPPMLGGARAFNGPPCPFPP